MNKTIFTLILLISLLAACSPAPETPPTAPPPPTTETIVPTTIPANTTANADVLFVRAEKYEDGTWRFDVTVSHPDTGWDDYADGWNVVLPDESVVTVISGEPFTRLLTHPHIEEQPFTRSQSGIEVPEGITQVTVRAHDLVDGFGGQEVIVYLEKASGLNFEVISPEAAPEAFTTGLTYLQPDGNRYIPASIDLLQTTPITGLMAGTPKWIVGVEDGSTLRWLIAAEDGLLHILEYHQGVTSFTVLPEKIPAGMPPVLTLEPHGGNLSYRNPEAPYTHPILTESGVLAFLNADQQLVLSKNQDQITVKINALPDGRILADGKGQFLILTDPTNEYAHAVLGDGLEAKSATLVNESGEITARILAPTDMVFEAIMPIWADINEDGINEIILTASNAEIGAQIMVYRPDGQIIAKSNPIGTGYRWRNQAAVAPFGPNRELELINVITPHLFGKVEFLQLGGDWLERAAEISGYTSHLIGTRNLDMILSGDLDADGLAEVLIPTQDLKALGIIKHTLSGAEVLAELPLDAPLSTNLAGIKTADGLAIAAGTENGTIYLWIP